MNPREMFIHDVALLFGDTWTIDMEKKVGERWDISVERQLGAMDRQIESMKLQIKRLNDMVGRS